MYLSFAESKLWFSILSSSLLLSRAFELMFNGTELQGVHISGGTHAAGVNYQQHGESLAARQGH
jgi:hypothetical protein